MSLASIWSAICILAIGIFIVLAIPLFIAFYIFFNVFTVAFIIRSSPTIYQKISAFALNQFEAISINRIWSNLLLQFLSIIILENVVTSRLEIFWLSLALLGYIFFTSGLALSLLAKLPYFRELWEDAFFKISAIAVPIFALYLTKGYATFWIGSLFKVNALLLPMTHLAATGFLLLCCIALLLSIATVIFESLYFSATSFSSIKNKTNPLQRSTLAMLTSLDIPKNPIEKIYLYNSTRKYGIIALMFINFLSCYIGIHACFAMTTSRIGEVVLSTIAFQFDLAPADRCNPTETEKRSLESSNANKPVIKALFLSSSQEKAILVTHEADLFNPIMLTELKSENPSLRKLSFGPIVRCNMPSKESMPKNQDQ